MTVYLIVAAVAILAAWLGHWVGWRGGIVEGKRQAQRRLRVIRNLERIPKTRSPW